MNVSVNGKPLQLPEDSTVAKLLQHLALEPARVAVERNQEVITRRTWDEARLREGDQIEIVTFVGGG